MFDAGLHYPSWPATVLQYDGQSSDTARAFRLVGTDVPIVCCKLGQATANRIQPLQHYPL